MNNEYENMKQELEEDWTVNELNFHSTQMIGTENVETMPVAAALPITANAGEDWTMNMSTNEIPVEETKGRWEMPEPVFRVSDGKQIVKSKTADTPSSAPPLELQSVQPAISGTAPPPVSNIQPQPYITEDFAIDDDDVLEESSSAKSGAGRKIFVVIGILAMILFAAGFLIGVYLLFFRNTNVIN